MALLRAVNVSGAGASCSSIAAMAWPIHTCAHTVGKLAMMAAALH
ncbi:hypothetical protein [Stenotrophomonas sp. G4]|nr:hypothetical protein [Stenotrophomonas sp. G4]